MGETFKFLASFLVLNVLLIVYVNAEYNCQYKKDGFYTDLEFCHVYWRCNYGVPEEYECPAGTAWNHIELRCDWLDMVDCTRGGTITQKPEETEAPETEEPEEEDSETDEPETDEPETTTLKATKNKDKNKSTTTTHVSNTTRQSTDESNQDTTAVALGLVAETRALVSVTESLINEVIATTTVVAPAAEPLVGDIMISNNNNNNDNLTLDSDSLPLVNSESLPMTSQESSKSDIISQEETHDETVMVPQTNALVQEETSTTVLASSEQLLAETSADEQAAATSNLASSSSSSSSIVISSTKKHKTTKKISSSEERKTFEYDTLCNGLLASTGFVSDPFICNKYLRCNHGVAERFTCASGTLWNSRDKMCTWPSLVDCDDREIFTENELVREETGAGGSSSSSSTSNEESESKDASASKEASASKLSSSKEETASSSSSSKETASQETSNSQETKPVKQRKNKNRLSSTKSLLTRKKKNGANVRELEAKETSNSTAAISTTTTVAAAPTTSSSNVSNLCQSVGTYHLPDNTNCASYFICTQGKEAHTSCPDRQLFNVETAQCEDFQMVFCGSRPVNHADKNQCASKRDGIYPDIERACRIFYQCVSQQKVREATCPSNLKFNSLTGRCDTSANIMAPCGTYNVALGTNSNGNSYNSAARHSYKFLSLKCLATLLALANFF